MAYRAIDVAKYTISKCVHDGCPISNLQLQKILYYIQRHFLTNKKLAFNDDIEAWQFGPVVPNVYYEFCSFGAMPITMDYSEIEIDNLDKRNFDLIIEEKRKLNPWDLVDDTHKTNGAWDKIYNNGHGIRKVIPISLIKKEIS